MEGALIFKNKLKGRGGTYWRGRRKARNVSQIECGKSRDKFT